ncbi:MAG TPA: TrkH family potassium uptake protein, partial [Candidatus Ozemobacteraceae bacterium]|nr:TrkH family potassium uptake protein [Candidatus Ozemobacteraceae bacterium]
MLEVHHPSPATETRLDEYFRAARRTMNAFAVLGLLFLALDPSFGRATWYAALKAFLVLPIDALFVLHLGLGYLRSKSSLAFIRDFPLDIIFFLPLFTLTFGGVHPSHIIAVRQFVHYFNRYLERSMLQNLAQNISERPARLIAMSFAGVILIGTFLLILPVSVSPGSKPSFLTALFTATSAVCVTGLNVIDPSHYFTLFGQIVIVFLIQIGGLGIMTMSAGVSLLIGKRFGMSQRSLMQNVLDQSDLAGLRNILIDILRLTFIAEAMGALILGARFYVATDCSFRRAAYLGVFHAISAFCNAGFSLFSDSLCGFAWDPIICFTVMGLIVSGGLGFAVLGVINGWILGSRRGPADVHTRLVVLTTLVLILVGAVFIYVLEFNGPAMLHLNGPEKLMAALFQSVTTRTAGFNTIDIAQMRSSSLFLMILFMFIGASPSSTGGGIKTTTLAVMLLALDAHMQGKNEVTAYERVIPGDVVLRSFLITAISATLVASYTFLLTLTENQDLIRLMFETASAFGTVGLSANLTPDLSPLGQFLIISLMFIGRIGPLTLALSVRAPVKRGDVRYPTTRVLV